MKIIIKNLFSFILLMIFSVAIMLYTINRYNFIKKSEKWPSIKGIITHSKLIYSSSKDKNKNGNDLYEAQINYTYRIYNTPFNSSRIAIDYSPSSNFNENDDLVSKYPKDKLVDVYYNPDELGYSVLIRGSYNNNALYTLITSLVFVILLILMYILLIIYNEKKIK